MYNSYSSAERCLKLFYIYVHTYVHTTTALAPSQPAWHYWSVILEGRTAEEHNKMQIGKQVCHTARVWGQQGLKQQNKSSFVHFTCKHKS